MKVLAAPRDATGVREEARCCEGRWGGHFALELQAPSCFAVFGEKKYLSRLKRQQRSGNYQTVLIVIYHPGCNKLFKAGFCLLKKKTTQTQKP